MTVLTTLNIPTIAHWIAASRQVLSDAPRLEGIISARLLYGLALAEEAEFLTGSGTGLHMSGLNTQATAFTGGVTNATALDTLARALTQLQLANCEGNGIVLHPSDWLAIKLLKTTTGEYLLGDPAQMTVPQLWGIPVVPTASQTQGKFTVLDARQAGHVCDREEAIVRISENVGTRSARRFGSPMPQSR